MSKGGWIRHRGGKCKLPFYTMVEIRMRDGLVSADFPGSFRWTHIGDSGDIMSYRKVQKDDYEIDESFQEAKAESKAISDEQSFDAISIRDEIKERKDEIEVNQNRIAELVEKLRSEGFALIEGEAAQAFDGFQIGDPDFVMTFCQVAEKWNSRQRIALPKADASEVVCGWLDDAEPERMYKESSIRALLEKHGINVID